MLLLAALGSEMLCTGLIKQPTFCEATTGFPANDAPSPRQGSGTSSVWNFSIVFLGCYFTGKPVVVWQNFVCFYTLALYLNFFP